MNTSYPSAWAVDKAIRKLREEKMSAIELTRTNPTCLIQYVKVVDVTGTRWTAKVYNAKSEIVDTVTTDSDYSCRQAAEKLVNWLIMKGMIK